MEHASDPKTTTGAHVNLRVIAEHCGFGVMTVSRALRGERYVSAETRARVLAVARELGYDPSRNQMARQMVMRRHGASPLNHTVGLFFPPLFTRDSSAVYYGPLFDSIMTIAVIERFSVLTNYVSFPKSEEEPYPYTMIEQLPAVISHGDVDGVLLIARPSEQQQLVRMLRDEPNFRDRPIVTLVEPTEGCSSVITDDFTSAYTAMKHLLELGHRHFLYFTELAVEYHCRRQRVTGYERALREYGIAPETALFALPWSWAFPETSVIDTRHFLDAHPEITAIFALYDPMAVLLYQHLRKQGRRIPEDISLVGHDDTAPVLDFGSDLLLSTTRVPLDTLGREAMLMLLRQIHDHTDTVEQLVLPSTFFPRTSTQPARLSNLA